jgi:alpha-mannosidase
MMHDFLTGSGRRLLFAFLLAGCLAGQPASKWPADAAGFRIHMIGNGHIDPVWLWPWPEGVSVVQSTFRSSLDRMKENPGFKFTASSAQFYEWVAANDPAMMAEIRQRVEEGRWGLVGGWWVEPDVNLPSGEALIRQGLYGQSTFQRLFGRIARVGFNPDSFGHPGTLPQILKLQGMDSYVFMRPAPNEKELPADVFWWQGPDGTKTLTYRIPFSYAEAGSVEPRLRRMIAELKEPTHTLMSFYGAGDHGGGGTKENLRFIDELKQQAGAPTLLYSTPEQYFREIRAEAAAFPAVEGDLQHHSVGCYTAESQIKKLNRAAELALVTAEKVAAVGSVAWGATYPKPELTAAWKRVLFLQFHDSLAGTSLPVHYQTTVPEGYGHALDAASQAMYLAAQKLAWQVPAEDPGSQYLLVFNPHAWETTPAVEYDIGIAPDVSVVVEDEKGQPISSQSNPPSSEVNGRQTLLARMALPAFGYRQIRIRRAQPAAPAAAVHAQGRTLENEHLAVTFGPDGGLGIFDKDARAAVFAGGATGARALVMDDPSDTWSHNVKAYSEQIGSFGNATVKVIENGPLRARVRVRTTYGASALTIDWLLYAGVRSLEARVALDWREHQKILKLSFPVDAGAPVPTYEVPYGHLARSANGDEDPGQRWIDLTGTRAGNPYGLTVVNDAKYGYSVAGNDMRISVVRGAPYAHHIPHVLAPDVEPLWQDQGTQTFRMLLVPHKGNWRDAGAPRIAEEFTVPPPVVYQGIHSGTRPQADSFLAVDSPDVIVAAIKQAEAGDDLIIRSVETAGQATKASIDLRFAKRKWSGSFRPSEIKTLRLNPRTGEIREVNALEQEAR